MPSAVRGLDHPAGLEGFDDHSVFRVRAHCGFEGMTVGAKRIISFDEPYSSARRLWYVERVPIIGQLSRPEPRKVAYEARDDR